MDASGPLDPLDPNLLLNRQSPTKSRTKDKRSPTLPIASELEWSELIALGAPSSSMEPAASPARPTLAGQPSFQRPRKRVIWRNKACIIALPLDNDLGRPTYRPDYLKPEEVRKQLKEWQCRGFDTRGFILASPNVEAESMVFEGQSRAVHPDPRASDHERLQRAFHVSVPNRQEWDAYVMGLREEKLRALGVTSIDEEVSSRKSPAPSLMSRQASSQSSAMLVSPSLAASSVPLNSSGPPYQLGTYQFEKPGVAHFPRYSVAIPFQDKGFGHAGEQSVNQSPILRNQSPHDHVLSHPFSRIASPRLSKFAHLRHAVLSPANATEHRETPQLPMPHSVGAFQSRQQQQTTSQNQQQQMLKPWPQPNKSAFRSVRNNITDSQSQHRSNVVTPTPHGHQQNHSESLQREVDEAEAFLEETEKEQPPLETMFTSPSRAIQSNRITTLSVGSSISNSHDTRSHDRSARLPDSDVPSDTSAGSVTEDRSRSTVTSKLNINAPEFKFESKTSFNKEASASLSGLQPVGSFQPDHLGKREEPSDIHPRRNSSISRASPRLNAAAPAFTPGLIVAPRPQNAARVFSFGALSIPLLPSDSKPVVSTREFSFSSSTPTFNPGAPIFEPSNIKRTTSDITGLLIETNNKEKIFGKLDSYANVKLAKKSKALPKSRPNLDIEIEEASDGPEDESGRITQSDARQKRLRRNHNDGDQVPQFALRPDNAAAGDVQVMAPDDHESETGDAPMPMSSIAEPTSLEAATDLLGEILDEMSASEASSLIKEDIRNMERGDSAAPYTSHDDAPLDTTPEDVVEATQEFLRKSSHFHSDSDDVVKTHKSISRSSSSSSSYVSHQMIEGDRKYRLEHADEARLSRQDILNGMRYIEPSYQEIDAVMKQLNQDGDSDVGIEPNPTPKGDKSVSTRDGRSPRQALQETVSRQLLPPANIRSDAPSPSPNRLRQPFQYLPPTDTESADSADVRMVARNARFSPSYRPSKDSPMIHRLNSPGSTPPSDWNDEFSSVDEGLLKSKTAFFDFKLNDIIAEVLQQRLSPIEESLSNIRHMLVHTSKRTIGRPADQRARSSNTLEVKDSDADDEDDTGDASQMRAKSPLKDRRYDQLKASISEVAVAQQGLAPASQLRDLIDAVNDLKSSVMQVPRATTPNDNIEQPIEDAVNRQMRFESAPIVSSTQAAAAEKSQLQLAGLESMLKIADSRVEDELKARRATEDALADHQRLLRQAVAEASQQRESAEATEAKLQDYYEERQHHLEHVAMLEGSQAGLEKTASDLTDKIEALESTLAEYRISHDQRRTDIDDARYENKESQRYIQTLKTELGSNRKELEVMRSKFGNLRENFASASRDVVADQAKWRAIENEHKSRLDLLATRLEAEARTRERLELEIKRLEAQVVDAMKARFLVDQTQKANAHLDRLVGQLRAESHDHQNAAARSKRELHAAKETGIMEVHRTRSAMEADLKAAKSDFSIVRRELQNTVTELEKQVEDASANAEKLSSSCELTLRDTSIQRNSALQELVEARNKALQEQQRLHERTLQEMKDQHQRVLSNALEDKQRTETLFEGRLSLAHEKLTHFQKHTIHLEEKLEVAKSAAAAAVQAAQASKTVPSVQRVSLITDSGAPEKISPQALRESILVLQEQLQARESHIEELEGEISSIDTHAPAKLKHADIEITWLRELLGVRVDDLQDIINRLSQPSYDRDSVRDAAIRLKANLQMEQQEKERALVGAQTFPSFSKTTSMAASPKALPLAAAAAWGNWRKIRDSGYSNLNAMTKGGLRQTPSKASSSPQTFLADLLTPPSINLRDVASNPAPRPSSSTSSQRLQRVPSTPTQNAAPGEQCSLQQQQQQDPITPPLMRKGSYDLDAAEAAVFGQEYDAVETYAGYSKHDFEVAEEEEPFGPRIGTFAS